MWCVLLCIASALAGAPTASDASATLPAQASDVDDTISPVWSGGTRDQIYGIVDLESEVKALGTTIGDLHLLSAELNWGHLTTTPAQGRQGVETNSFSNSSLTVTRERVLDAELIDSVESLEDTSSYDLSNPNERARLCTRLPGQRGNALELHTWTPHAANHGDNDIDRRGDTPSVLMAEGEASRTAMVSLQPGESVTLVSFADSSSKRRAQRRLEVRREARTLTVTEGDASSKVCLEY